MTHTPILASTYVARSVNVADARMVNLYPEAVAEGGKEAAFLNRAPGLRRIRTVGTGPIRGMHEFGGFMYVVSGNEVYRLDNNFDTLFLGNVPRFSGAVSMADNGTQLFIACNPEGFIYNAATNVFAQITDPDFPGAVNVAFLDGYFVFNEPHSQRIWVTSLLDGTSVDPLDFASAEGSPDGVVGIIIDHRELWILGTNSVEVWYNAGNADFPLQRIQGAFTELGCAAPYSIAKMDNSIFWLGKDNRGHGIVYQSAGYTGKRISTHAVEWNIQSYGDISDASAYTYQQEGHYFYVLVFPTANTTWVYDAATGMWHERAGFMNGEFTRHRGDCQVFFNNTVVIGDYANGNIYAFDLNVFADDGQIQRWLRSWRAIPTGQNDLKRTAHHSLQLDMETGVGLNGLDENYVVTLDTESGFPITTESGIPLTLDFVLTVGANPKVMLRWSDDGGHTWSTEHWVTVGKIGVFGHRAVWRRLGMTQKLRDRVYEISGTDPVKIAIVGAELFASGTNA